MPIEKPGNGIAVAEVTGNSEASSIETGPIPNHARYNPGVKEVPLSWKLVSIVLVTGIGFGSSWSSGITAAMKTTLKKVRPLRNQRRAYSNSDLATTYQ